MLKDFAKYLRPTRQAREVVDALLPNVTARLPKQAVTGVVIDDTGRHELILAEADDTRDVLSFVSLVDMAKYAKDLGARAVYINQRQVVVDVKGERALPVAALGRFPLRSEATCKQADLIEYLGRYKNYLMEPDRVKDLERTIVQVTSQKSANADTLGAEVVGGSVFPMEFLASAPLLNPLHELGDAPSAFTLWVHYDINRQLFNVRRLGASQFDEDAQIMRHLRDLFAAEFDGPIRAGDITRLAGAVCVGPPSDKYVD